MAKTRKISLIIKLYIVLLILLAGLLIFEYRRHNFTVTCVVDASTIILNNDELVKLIGVDTPDINQPFQSVEHYGREATDFTKKMVEGKAIRLEYDEREKDKLGRWLAYIYLKDGTFLNAEIIKEGYGRTYTKLPFKYREQFSLYEKQARENKKGLWAQIPQE